MKWYCREGFRLQFFIPCSPYPPRTYHMVVIFVSFFFVSSLLFLLFHLFKSLVLLYYSWIFEVIYLPTYFDDFSFLSKMWHYKAHAPIMLYERTPALISGTGTWAFKRGIRVHTIIVILLLAVTRWEEWQSTVTSPDCAG